MVAKAIELLQVSNTDRILDLYCGIGNFSLPLARRAAAVLALEVEQLQVDRGRFNATHNKIENSAGGVAIEKNFGANSYKT